MKKIILSKALVLFVVVCSAQNVLTPEAMWKLGRVSGVGITKDGKSVVYAVSTPDVEQNRSVRKLYAVPLSGGPAKQVHDSDRLVPSDRISPDGKGRNDTKRFFFFHCAKKEKLLDLSPTAKS